MSIKINGKNATQCVLGTWSWGSGINGSKMIFGENNSIEELKETFDTAIKNGFNFWDTAEVYGMGNTEKILGSFIKKQNDIVISSKHMPGKRYKENENINAIKGSLERLNIDYIDLYWLHSPKSLKENMKELAECEKIGLIKSIGLSNCNIEQIKESNEILKKYGTKIIAVQNHFSLLSIEREMNVLEYCKEKGILFFGYMTLEQGALTGHYDEENHFPLLTLRGITFGKSKFRRISKLLKYIKKLGLKYNVDSSQIPIAWTIAKGVIPIVGVAKAKHAVLLKYGMDVKLEKQEVEQLEKLALDSGVKCKGIWE